MQLTLNIPDELVRLLTAHGKDPARVALEALALEGYRTDILTEHQVCVLLGLDSRLDVHAFLKQHGVYLHYSDEEIAQDAAASSAYQRQTASEENPRHAR